MSARIGVVGCGWWATEAHLPALERNPNAVIAAIADPSADKRETAMGRFPVEAAFASLEEMVEHAKLDGVIVATPHDTHYDLARQSLERGLHTLVEKPMTLRPEDAHDLVARARDRRVELIVGYPWNYNRQTLELKRIISEGAIGVVEFASCLFASIARELYSGNPAAYADALGYTVNTPDPRTYVVGGGQGQTQITHSLALLLWLTGLELETVSAMSQGFGLDVDLCDVVSLTFSNGALASMSSTGSVTPRQPEMLEYRIFGTDGHIAYDVNGGTATVYHEDGRTTPLEALAVDDRYPASAPADNLVELVLEQGTNGSPGELGAATVAAIDAMYESARTGRRVSVRENEESQYVGHVWRTKEGMAEEYASRHAGVWPEMKQLLERAGVSTYAIYSWGDLLFSHLETRDFDQVVQAFADSEVAKAWDEHFSDVLEYPNADAVTGWPEQLREVWRLRTTGPSSDLDG